MATKIGKKNRQKDCQRINRIFFQTFLRQDMLQLLYGQIELPDEGQNSPRHLLCLDLHRAALTT